MWLNEKISYLVDNAGYVISIHKVTRICIVTVTRDGIITIWNIRNTNWLRTDRITIGNAGVVSTFSCLSYKGNFLAVLNDNGDVVLFKLQNDTITLPPCFKIAEYFRKKYITKSTCCEISQNEKYLGIGLENGDISVRFRWKYS